MTLRNVQYSALLLIAALVLTGCGSELTSIEAPDAVSPNESFEVEIDHEWLEQFSPRQAVPNATLMLIVAAPDEWTPSPQAQYVGTVDGGEVDVQYDMVLLSAPPMTNYNEYVEAGGETLGDPFPELLDCNVQLEPDDTPGFTYHFYQATELFFDDTVRVGDSGTFTFIMQSGPNAGTYELGAVHALYGEWTGDIEQQPTDVTQCTLLTDEPQGTSVSSISTTINQFESAAPPPAPTPGGPTFVRPVPVDGALALLVLASLMLLAGFYLGRKP
ncbi:MAG: hypothetical protein AAGH19_08110 [Pseudomonadota bacterium]